MECFECGKIFEEMTSMMKREYEITHFPICKDCHNDMFTGIWCINCNIYTESSERPIVFKNGTNWLEFACKKCLNQKDNKKVFVASICHECKKKIVFSNGQILYGPSKCVNNYDHVF